MPIHFLILFCSQQTTSIRFRTLFFEHYSIFLLHLSCVCCWTNASDVFIDSRLVHMLSWPLVAILTRWLSYFPFIFLNSNQSRIAPLSAKSPFHMKCTWTQISAWICWARTKYESQNADDNSQCWKEIILPSNIWSRLNSKNLNLIFMAIFHDFGNNLRTNCEENFLWWIGNEWASTMKICRTQSNIDLF